MKIKKGDTIIVTTGKNRGKQAKVERVFPGLQSVLIPGVNEYKKHRKSQGENKPGEILTLNRPMLLSKVALVCPKCKQQTRVGYKFINGNKIRVCRKCDADIN